jgi:katanin p60 ATPase-containing subunit A1
MNSNTNIQRNDSDAGGKISGGGRQNFIAVTKKAREYSYLGMYEEAAKIYREALADIESRQHEKKSSNLVQAYADLAREVRKEAEVNEYMLFMIKNGRLPPQPGQPPRQEKKLPFNSKPFTFHQDMGGVKPDGVAQYGSNNSMPGYSNPNLPGPSPSQFGGHHNRHTSLNKPQMREHVPKSYDPTSHPFGQVNQNHSNRFLEEGGMGNQDKNFGHNHQFYPQSDNGLNQPNYYGNIGQNIPNPQWNPMGPPPGNYGNNYYGQNQPYSGFDYNDQQNYRGFPPAQPVPPKDPMVWDPPSPKPLKQPKRPLPPVNNQKNPQPPGANNNYLDKHKREYDKPWLKKPTNSNSTGQGKRSNSANKNSNMNIVINGVEKQKYLYSVYPDGNGPDADLINMIENNLITTNPSITFDDIAGLQDAKEALIMYVVCSLNMKNFFRDIRSPPKGILLFGPPGTGKTMLAKAIATTGKTTFINVNPATLASKWKGDSEKLVRILFDMARYYTPTTIFIDEIDSLLSERSSTEHESSRKVKTQFFTEIDGLTTNISDDKEKEVPKVFLLAATNRPWDLDDAIMRRLTKRIYIPLPNAESRRKLFEIKLKNINLRNDVDFDYLVKNTDRYNSDDIESVCREAAMAPFKRRMASLANQQSTQILRDIENEIINEEICMEDFVKAIQNVKSSASDKYTAQYDEWKVSHGST